ncbi:MAG: phage Gp37/Gp68 family protein [bacterium]|nr:phage Gp37/Gp68 family protein [bacterium]
MAKSSIEWTEATWNPVTGCTKISAGCKHCYAERMSKRLQAMGAVRYKNAFELTLHPHVLKEPYSWRKSRTVFVNSMSDLFHKDIPLEFIQEIFKVMNDNPRHTFQVLTKRAHLLQQYNKELTWSDNIWMGVTVENSKNLDRIDLLRETDAVVKFLSIEPLIGPIDRINLNQIDWVVVGGESGPGARPMKEEWVSSIKDQCLKENVPFFFKQWGGINKKKTGRLFEGKTWDQMPVVMAV